uniref:Uncharacterized protein n=1 Tax=uncultured organism TaxID=155900 RepID=M1QC17_9ZZZZ|nr:hypothetical protein FLSS-10_0008 [uncultured organism]
MKNSEKDELIEVFESVKPYLNFPQDLESVVRDEAESSSSLQDFENKFDKLVSEEEDPTVRADYRIFLNKLRSK